MAGIDPILFDGTSFKVDHVDLIDQLVLDPFPFTEAGVLPRSPAAGPVTNTQPVTENPRSRSGSKLPLFGDDWYNRIHITPKTLNLGAMLSNYNSSVSFWNAHLEPVSFQSLTATNNSGVSLDSGVGPYSITPLKTFSWPISVTTDGPPDIAAEYQITFSSEVITFSVVGTRSILWHFVPQAEHSETLEWNTDVIQAFTGEQRSALTPAPRQSFEYEMYLNPSEFSQAKNLSRAWSFRVFGCPVWSEFTRVGAINAGASEILVDTSYADWRSGEYVFIWESNQKNIGIQIDTVLSDRLVLKTPLSSSFDVAHAMPIRFSYNTEGFSFNRGPNELIKLNTTFMCPKGVDIANTTYPQLDSIDVLTDRTISTSVSDKIYHSVDVLDTGFGAYTVDINRSEPDVKFQISLVARGRADKWRVRRWLHSLKGKLGVFWLPTWNNDVVVLNSVDATGANVRVTSTLLSRFFSERGLMIELKNGTRVFAKVVSATNNSDGSETLVLSAPIGTAIDVSNIQRACFMHKMRLDTDSVELKHRSYEEMTVSATVVEVLA